jgi:hypothetical protein
MPAVEAATVAVLVAAEEAEAAVAAVEVVAVAAAAVVAAANRIGSDKFDDETAQSACMSIPIVPRASIRREFAMRLESTSASSNCEIRVASSC